MLISESLSCVFIYIFMASFQSFQTLYKWDLHMQIKLYTFMQVEQALNS